MRFLLLLLLAAMISCGDETFNNDLDLPKAYSYTVTFNCFCLPRGPFDLTIENNEVIQFETEENFDYDDEQINSFTIPALIERVNNILSQNPVRKDIMLNELYGFPEKVYFDIEERIADEEWGYEITDFQVIED